MPATAEKRQGKWRVINADTGNLERGRSGKPVDGGGHATEERARAQARAINANN